MSIYESAKQIREALKNVSKYRNSKNWHRKVDKMDDSQVYAIYISFRKRGLIL